jgi:putative nucleotidyltransferase with HDIG domain
MEQNPVERFMAIWESNKKTYFELLEMKSQILSGKLQSPDSPISEKGYRPIDVTELVVNQVLHFDCYIRLGKNHYVRVFEAQKPLDMDRLSSFLKKGSEKIYVRNESVARCISYCQFLEKSLVNSPEVSDSIKAAQFANEGEDLWSDIHEEGATVIDEFKTEMADGYVQNVFNFMAKLDLQDQKKLTEFLSQASAFEHSVTTTMLSALIAIELKMTSSASARAIGMVAFFHDIGRDPKTVDDSLDRDHPTKGATVLEQIKGIDSVIVQGVRQHHERKDGSGYPNKVEPESISPIAEIVGVAEEYSRLLIETQDVAKAKAAILQNLSSFSSEISTAFAKAIIRV